VYGDKGVVDCGRSAGPGDAVYPSMLARLNSSRGTGGSKAGGSSPLNAVDALLGLAGSLPRDRLVVERVSSKIAAACFTSSSVDSRTFPIPCSQTEMQPSECHNDLTGYSRLSNSLAFKHAGYHYCNLSQSECLGVPQ